MILILPRAFIKFLIINNNNNNNNVGRRAMLRTADPREGMFLYQWISVAIQRFNAVCLTNSLTVSESPS